MAQDPDAVDFGYPKGSDARTLFDKFVKLNPHGWVYGKDPPVTWWQKKVVAYAKDVEDGMYGKILSREIKGSGWFDDVYLPYYRVVAKTGDERNYQAGDVISLSVTESGVFYDYPTGGSGNISKVHH